MTTFGLLCFNNLHQINLFMNHLKTLSLLFISVILFTACDLDELGLEVIEIPDELNAPNFSTVEMNLDAFPAPQNKDHFEASSEETGNYETARSTVLMLDEQLQLFTGTLDQMISPIENLDPDNQNGGYTWFYDAYAELLDAPLDIEMRANLGTSTIDWTGYVSGVIDNQDVDNVELFTGATNVDGSGGEFSLNFGEQGTSTFYDSFIDWQIDNDELSNLELNLEIGDQNLAVTYFYSVEGNTATIEGQNVINEQFTDYVIEWDLETEAGSITTEDGGQMCWDEEKQNTPC